MRINETVRQALGIVLALPPSVVVAPKDARPLPLRELGAPLTLADAEMREMRAWKRAPAGTCRRIESGFPQNCGDAAGSAGAESRA